MGKVQESCAKTRPPVLREKRALLGRAKTQSSTRAPMKRALIGREPVLALAVLGVMTTQALALPQRS